MERRGRIEDAKREIEAHLDGDAECPRNVGPKDMLAYAYLIDASGVAPKPTASNAQLVEMADEILGGNYDTLPGY